MSLLLDFGFGLQPYFMSCFVREARTFVLAQFRKLIRPSTLMLCSFLSMRHVVFDRKLVFKCRRGSHYYHARAHLQACINHLGS
jgi:hypothetical protein